MAKIKVNPSNAAETQRNRVTRVILVGTWNGTQPEKIVRQFLTKVNMQLPYNPAVALDVYLREIMFMYSLNLYSGVHSSSIGNSPKTETTPDTLEQVTGWATVVHPMIKRKVVLIHTQPGWVARDLYLVKKRPSRKVTYVMLHLYNIFEMTK